jgi:hypothetical protein
VTTPTIHGYTFGTEQVPRSPVTEQDLQLLKATLLWTDEDDRALRQAGEVLADQVEDVLDLWYGYVGSHDHLVATFAGADGTPDAAYLDAVRARFAQWIRDTCSRPYDRSWLDYQEEIALRHHRAKKNRTDGVESPSDHVPLRYLIAFVWPITATVRDFLARKGHPADQVDAMHTAWFKAVVLHAVLWARPYSTDW